MGPRKRSKPNPQSKSELSLESLDPKPATETQADAVPSTLPPTKAGDLKHLREDTSVGKQAATVRTSLLLLNSGIPDLFQSPSISDAKWYGSWPRGFKSNPITQVARESISATNDIASTFLVSPATKSTQSSASSLKSPALRRLSRSVKSSTSSPSILAANPNSDVSSSPSGTATPLLTPSSEPPQLLVPKRDVDFQIPEKSHQEISQDISSSQHPPATVTQAKTDLTDPKKTIGDSSKWVSWFSKSSTALSHDSPVSDGTSAKIEPSPKGPSEQQGTLNLPKPGPVDDFNPAPGLEEPPPSLSSSPVHPAAAQAEPRNWSWLGLWKDAAIQPKDTITITNVEPIKEANHSSTPPEPTNDSENVSKPSSLDTSSAIQPSALSKSAGWTFWSKDRSQEESSKPTETTGKLVLAKLPSQSPPDNDVTADAPKNKTKSAKQEKSQSTDIPNGTESAELVKVQPPKGKTSSTAVVDSNSKSTEKADVRTKKDPVNLVLPAFKNTYKAVGKPSFVQQISRLLKYTRPPDIRHVNLLQEPARIRNALVIVR